MGIVIDVPIFPLEAILSIHGVLDDSNDVGSEESSNESAMPSGTIIKYFMLESEDI